MSIVIVFVKTEPQTNYKILFLQTIDPKQSPGSNFGGTDGEGAEYKVPVDADIFIYGTNTKWEKYSKRKYVISNKIGYSSTG